MSATATRAGALAPLAAVLALALAALAAWGLSAAPAVTFGVAGASLAWLLGTLVPRVAIGLAALLTVTAAAWFLVDGRPILPAAAAVLAALVVALPRLAPRRAAVPWRMVRVIAAVVGVLLVAGGSAAAGRGSLGLPILLAGAAAWFLLASGRLGPLKATLGVLTAGIPLYGVPWLRVGSEATGPLTVALGLGLLVLLLHRRAVGWRALLRDRNVWLLLAFGGWMVLSLLLATRTGTSVALVKSGIGRALVFPLLVLALVVALGRREGFRAVATGGLVLVALGAIGSLLSIPQVALEAGYPTAGDATRYLDQFVGKRAIGISESPLVWSSFLLLPLGMAGARWLAERDWRFGAAAGLCTVGLLLASVRSGWLATAVMMVVAILLVAPTLQMRILAVASIAFAVLAVSQIGNFRDMVAGGDPSAGVGVGKGRLGIDDSASTRLTLLRIQKDLGSANPLTGVGMGNVGYAIERDPPEYIQGERANPEIVPGEPIDKHNTYVGFFAELGVPGALLFLALVGGGLVTLLRMRRRVSPEERIVVDGLLLALLGTAVAAAFTDADRQPALWWLLGTAFALRVLTREEA